VVERRELGQGGRGLQRRGRLTALLDQVLAAHGGREAWEIRDRGMEPRPTIIWIEVESVNVRRAYAEEP
jgi:hypothetical protein